MTEILLGMESAYLRLHPRLHYAICAMVKGAGIGQGLQFNIKWFVFVSITI